MTTIARLTLIMAASPLPCEKHYDDFLYSEKILENNKFVESCVKRNLERFENLKQVYRTSFMLMAIFFRVWIMQTCLEKAFTFPAELSTVFYRNEECGFLKSTINW